MLADYMNYLQEKGVSKNTITAYINDLKAFLDDLGIAPDDFVTSTDIRKWVNNMLNPTDTKPLAVATINRRLNSLRSYYSWELKNNRLQHYPMDDVKDLKSADDDSEKIMWLTEDELRMCFI